MVIPLILSAGASLAGKYLLPKIAQYAGGSVAKGVIGGYAGSKLWEVTSGKEKKVVKKKVVSKKKKKYKKKYKTKKSKRRK